VRGDVFDPAAGQVGQRNQPSADNKNPLAGGSEEGKAKDDTKARWTEELWLKQGYENLADLHMKQKRYAEAVEAYQKALDQSKDLKQQDAIRAKLLDALKAQLNVIDSVLAQSRETQDLRKKLLDSAQAYLKGVEGDLVKQLEAKPKSSPLASKLIIVAPKELLDQVGQGKMSFDDFRKAATVEYLTFGGSK
jgi:tetratricopeptide (TPR) repeat protein